ncbi:MAG: hypothetical protein H7175_16880 [Burkholderiales bacterium]|nr:hypothetical protein [Anaerolineae bacterium]
MGLQIGFPSRAVYIENMPDLGQRHNPNERPSPPMSVDGPWRAPNDPES